MHLGMHVIVLLCLSSVIYADRSNESAECQRFDDDNNCEPFSFQQISQNFTIAPANNSIETKNVTAKIMKTADVIENQLGFKESTIQEDGNFGVKSFIVALE